jgi:hypothetical protein
MRKLTFGCEHEWADIPCAAPLPRGYGWDRRDITIVNSNGIANDPTGKLYHLGGEINTPPTSTAQGQASCLYELRQLLPMARINYRSNLHVHVRVPGLKDDLALLKKFQATIHDVMPSILEMIEPIPVPTVDEYPDGEEYQGAMRRYRRRKVSHHTLLPAYRWQLQMAASTIEDFFRLEVPHTKNRLPMWHAQPRLCVNLRQLRETDTIEFRHFPGTLEQRELVSAICWCRYFVNAVLDDVRPTIMMRSAKAWVDLPTFPPYVHWMEKRYRATVHDGTVSKADIAKNIKLIESGEFR